MADGADAIAGVPTADERLSVGLVVLGVVFEDVVVPDAVFGVAQVEKDFVLGGALEERPGTTSRLLLQVYKKRFKIKYSRRTAMAPWFRLCLQSWGPGFESLSLTILFQLMPLFGFE